MRLLPLLALSLLALSACKQIDELVNPKSVEQKLADYMEGTWRVDSLITYTEEQGVIRNNKAFADYGTIQFGNISTETGSNFYVGRMIRAYTDMSGAHLDSLWWYAGTWGSTSSDANRLTLFTANDPDKSFDSNSMVVFDAKTKDDKLFIFEGTRGVQDLGNGIITRYTIRYRLSR